jgi:hypothetical protein
MPALPPAVASCVTARGAPDDTVLPARRGQHHAVGPAGDRSAEPRVRDLEEAAAGAGPLYATTPIADRRGCCVLAVSDGASASSVSSLALRSCTTPPSPLVIVLAAGPLVSAGCGRATAPTATIATAQSPLQAPQRTLTGHDVRSHPREPPHPPRGVPTRLVGGPLRVRVRPLTPKLGGGAKLGAVMLRHPRILVMRVKPDDLHGLFNHVVSPGALTALRAIGCSAKVLF